MKIKLTENKLKQIVAESVKKVLRENYNEEDAIRELEAVIGFTYSKTEPVEFAEEFESALYFSLSADEFLRKYPDEDYENEYDFDYNKIEEYATAVWNQSKKDYEEIAQKIANEYKATYEALESCVKMLNDFKAGRKIVRRGLDDVE